MRSTLRRFLFGCVACALLAGPALADSLSRACYQDVTNLRRVYRLNADKPVPPG